MARQSEASTRETPWRNRFVVLVAVLVPILVAGGILAPQVVSVMIDESQLEEQTDGDATELRFDQPLPGVPPLPLPRDFDIGFTPELLDLQHLFTRSRRPELPMSQRFSRLLSFPRNHGDLIVMDDVDRQIRDVVFKDPIMVGAVTDIGPPDPDLLALGDPRPFGDGLQFDDPISSGVGELDPIPAAIPEPNTFAMLLLGLLSLACYKR